MVMRLQMTMKRPVFFPELDPQNIQACLRAASAKEALQAYCEAVLDDNEPCMEASESAYEIIIELRKLHCGIAASKCGPDAYLLTKDNLALTLKGDDNQEQVFLEFSKGRSGIDLSDFGPRDSAGFIKTAFASYDKVAAAFNQRICQG